MRTRLALVLVIQRSSEAMMSGSACEAIRYDSLWGGKCLVIPMNNSLNARLPPGSMMAPVSSSTIKN